MPSNQFNNSPPSNSFNSTPPANSFNNSGFTLENPLNVDSFCELLSALFSVVATIAIPVAVVFVVYAGLKFVLARGNPGKLQEANKNLKYTLIGIALFFGAWFLAQVIANTLVQLGGSEFNTCI